MLHFAGMIRAVMCVCVCACLSMAYAICVNVCVGIYFEINGFAILPLVVVLRCVCGGK